MSLCLHLHNLDCFATFSRIDNWQRLLCHFFAQASLVVFLSIVTAFALIVQWWKRQSFLRTGVLSTIRLHNRSRLRFSAVVEAMHRSFGLDQPSRHKLARIAVCKRVIRLSNEWMSVIDAFTIPVQGTVYVNLARESCLRTVRLLPLCSHATLAYSRLIGCIKAYVAWCLLSLSANPLVRYATNRKRFLFVVWLRILHILNHAELPALNQLRLFLIDQELLFKSWNATVLLHTGAKALHKRLRLRGLS